jgi:GntR family transcriptional repressor for pyruvate dehydrogenase complex
MPVFAPVKARRIFEEVVMQIREQIVSGRLKPGDKLPAERDLAEQFSVSRNAVREALRVLERSGTVQLKKGVSGGAFISAADPKVIAASLQDMLHLGRITAEQLTEARIWIESVITRIVCQTGTEDDFDRLEANIERARKFMQQGRHLERVEENIEFHNVLAEATRNPVLILNMAMLMDIMRFFASRIEPGDGQVIYESRLKLMQHLRARNAERAAAEMTAMLKRITGRYQNLQPVAEPPARRKPPVKAAAKPASPRPLRSPSRS